MKLHLEFLPQVSVFLVHLLLLQLEFLDHFLIGDFLKLELLIFLLQLLALPLVVRVLVLEP